MPKISYKIIAAQILAHRELFAREGFITSNYRNIAGRKFGPYFRLAYRNEHNRQLSIYLGRNKRLVHRVQSLLDKLKTPLLHRRESNRIYATLLAGLRLHKNRWKSDLAARGLYLKGFAARGWRNMPAAGKMASVTVPNKQLNQTEK
jgi:hypothetical protein